MSLSDAIGASGLLMFSAGIGLRFGYEWALMAAGALLITVSVLLARKRGG